jgi:nicotinate-nucleotide pyrophosphorylase (carboxylating)
VKNPDKEAIKAIVDAALDEDGAHSDATIKLVGVGESWIEADVVAGESGVICGVDVAREVFHQMDPTVDFYPRITDGDDCGEGDVVVSLAGPARAIIAAERVALNFMQRLSGIATLTAEFVEMVSGTEVTILDTRKTTPLLRDLEKYAVRCGGAENHRRDLRAMVLVKENHIRAIGGADALIERLNESREGGGSFVEVEVDSVDFLRKLLGSPVDRVMLDNFTPKRVLEALRVVSRFKRSHPDLTLEVEVSGGVTLDNISQYALEGVDYISVGAITHSAPALTLSVEVQ